MSSRPIVDGVRILWDGVAWPVATTSRRLTSVGASDFILRYRWLVTIVRKLCCVKRLGDKREPHGALRALLTRRSEAWANSYHSSCVIVLDTERTASSFCVSAVFNRSWLYRDLISKSPKIRCLSDKTRKTCSSPIRLSSSAQCAIDIILYKDCVNLKSKFVSFENAVLWCVSLARDESCPHGLRFWRGSVLVTW